MRQIITNLYKFEELSKKVQKSVLDSVRFTDFIDDCYDDSVSFIIDNFTDLAFEKYGIKINVNDVNYSGFWSQGDGASFVSNDILTDVFISAVGLTIPKTLLPYQELLLKGIELKIERSDWYYSHCNTVSAYCYNFCVDIPDSLESEIEQFCDIIAKKLKDVKNELCDTLYCDLKTEYYYHNSDEYLTDFIIMNEYEFYEDGQIF